MDTTEGARERGGEAGSEGARQGAKGRGSEPPGETFTTWFLNYVISVMKSLFYLFISVSFCTSSSKKLQVFHYHINAESNYKKK